MQDRLITLYMILYFYSFRVNVNLVIVRSCQLAAMERCIVKTIMPSLEVGYRSLLTWLKNKFWPSVAYLLCNLCHCTYVFE
jgi:hypothetical protein